MRSHRQPSAVGNLSFVSLIRTRLPPQHPQAVPAAPPGAGLDVPVHPDGSFCLLPLPSLTLVNTPRSHRPQLTASQSLAFPLFYFFAFIYNTETIACCR